MESTTWGSVEPSALVFNFEPDESEMIRRIKWMLPDCCPGKFPVETCIEVSFTKWIFTEDADSDRSARDDLWGSESERSSGESAVPTESQIYDNSASNRTFNWGKFD